MPQEVLLAGLEGCKMLVSPLPEKLVSSSFPLLHKAVRDLRDLSIGGLGGVISIIMAMALGCGSRCGVEALLAASFSLVPAESGKSHVFRFNRWIHNLNGKW